MDENGLPITGNNIKFKIVSKKLKKKVDYIFKARVLIMQRWN